MEHRRRWAAAGRLPPGLAARYTLAEQAVLSLIAAETARRGDCRLAIEHMAVVAGVSRSTSKSAIREARKLGLLTVEERKARSWRNDTNVVRIVSPVWQAWLRLAQREDRAGKRVATPTVRKGGGANSHPPRLLRSLILEKRGHRDVRRAICSHWQSVMSTVANCRRVRPPLRCGRPRAGLMLLG